jgi:hypothetical protein
VNSADQPTFPPGRYGRRRTPGTNAKPLVIALAVGVLALLTFFGIRLYQAYGDQDYSAEVTRFTTSDGAVDVEFIIRLPEGGKAECVVRARDAAGLEVGRGTVEVSAGAEPNRTVGTYRLATRGTPVTGELAGCGPASAR